MWTGTRQADSTRTVYVRGAEGGGRANGDDTASLQIGIAAGHGDSEPGFVAEEGRSSKVALGGPFIPTYFRDHGLSLQSASLLVFAQLHTNNAMPSLSATGHTLLKFYLSVLLYPNLLPAAVFYFFLLFFFLPDTWWYL